MILSRAESPLWGEANAAIATEFVRLWTASTAAGAGRAARAGGPSGEVDYSDEFSRANPRGLGG